MRHNFCRKQIFQKFIKNDFIYLFLYTYTILYNTNIDQNYTCQMTQQKNMAMNFCFYFRYNEITFNLCLRVRALQ